MAGILIFGEQGDDGLDVITRELTAVGRRISEALSADVGVALIGPGATDAPQDAISSGADKVFVGSSRVLWTGGRLMTSGPGDLCFQAVNSEGDGGHRLERFVRIRVVVWNSDDRLPKRPGRIC